MPLSASGRSGLVDAMRQDAMFVRRGLRRHPSFTLVAVATLAIGVGAATTMLSIANGVLLKSPPIPAPERVVSIWELRSENAFESMEGRLLPFERYEAYRAATREVFSGLAAHSYAHLSVATSGSEGGAFAVDGFFTSDDYFTVLGTMPAAGRLYTTEGDPGVVLSERLWRARFGADPGVVGSTISVDSRPMVVAGIAPPGFVGTMSTFTGDVWVPAAAYRDLGAPDESLPLVVPIGRLAGDVERERAEDLVNRVAPLLLGEGERFGIRGARLDDIRWRADLSGPLQVGLATLLGAAVMLMLVACANIAGLVMARSYDRRREVAVRLAIGSGRARLIRQMIAENVVLFALGGAGGLAVATLATALLSSIDAPLNATITLDLAPDLRVFAIGLSVALATGIVFGLGPARQASKLDLTTSLKEGGSGLSKRRNAFVVGQLAVATTLLVVAGLAVRSHLEVLDVPLGFEPEGVVVATLDLGSHGYDVEAGRAFYQRLLDDVRTLPGVRSAGLGEVVMLGGAAYGAGVRPVDWEPDADRVGTLRNVVDPGYFTTTRTPILAGRAVEPTDVAASTPVVVINERLAARLWPGESALGRRFEVGGREYEVVGITADGVYAFVFEDPRYFAYYAFAQRYRPVMSLHVRADDPERLAPLIRSMVAEIDPNVAAQGVRSMEDVVHSNRFMPRFLARSIGGFAMVGLLLASLGVYGMLAVQVAQRRREFGVRQALGAKATEILGLVVSRGARLAVVGCALGLVAALFGARLLASLLYGVDPFDPVTFVGVPAVLIAVSVAASLRPALQATRVDPSTMLREE